MDQTEAPEHRACRKRTPEEDRAVFQANMRLSLRAAMSGWRSFAEALASVGMTPTGRHRFDVTPVAGPDFTRHYLNAPVPGRHRSAIDEVGK